MDNGRIIAAIGLAHKYHAGQVDKKGQPYLAHVLRVGAAGRTPQEKIVGYLHDTVEDTALTLDVIRETFGDEIADAVDADTRRPHETYVDYIRRLSSNPLARQVKIHDLHDNLLPHRLNGLPPKMKERLLSKYTHALALLGEPLDERREDDVSQA